MDKVSGRLTVFFEDPFWVGVFERTGKSATSSVFFPRKKVPVNWTNFMNCERTLKY